MVGDGPPPGSITGNTPLLHFTQRLHPPHSCSQSFVYEVPAIDVAAPVTLALSCDMVLPTLPATVPILKYDASNAATHADACNAVLVCPFTRLSE